MANENNEKKRWGRRVGSVIVWGILLTVAYYIVLFKGVDLSWWSEYGKFMTYGLGFLVGGLTATDLVATLKK